MIRLEDIRKGARVDGIDAGQAVTVVTVAPVGADALTVYYKTDENALRERMLFRSDEPSLSLAVAGHPWAFDAPGEEFKLAAEAYRINLAWLFDPMMAVHASNIDPLPHQITAVYESMLPRQPLRFVLADDPGAGKTIMAGLLMRELTIRADARRILIVSPGSLVEQWQDEMREKFGLEFTIFGRDLLNRSSSGNPFDEYPFLIARLDQLSRDEDLLAKLGATSWDLAVVDEAHKLSASWYGTKLNETKRFKLGKVLGKVARHFLLMTATPHNGKEEEFQLFLSLLDSDRFYGKFRDGAHRVDTHDIIRRMTKEEMVKFDGTRLFPERIAKTVNYKLSELEAALYAAVTNYVKDEMNRADRLVDGSRKGTVGFALTCLQRRLASSPEAIYQSLKRRRERLQRRLEEERLQQRGRGLSELLTSQPVPENLNEAEEELTAEEYEEVEEKVVDQATAAETLQELAAEIESLKDLEAQARAVVHSGQDRKWEELSQLLQNTPAMKDAGGNHRKLIVFTEHRDTLNYLASRIRGLLGDEEAVVLIHGGVHRDERRKIQEQFRNEPGVKFLIATDAAGEGINLQNTNLMVNYDLPWNPNRLEQRFGRIHRIGQSEVCHLWNLVAKETREGEVFDCLFSKLEAQRESLRGRVFDILGEVFEEKSLREMLIEAIRYGEDPDTKAKMEQQVENAFNPEHLQEILARNALSEETMSADRLFAVRDEMEKAQARRLQPYFIRSFFRQAFADLGGQLLDREKGRFEITHVPGVIRERDRLIPGRSRGSLAPVTRHYERVCFEKQFVRIAYKPMASLLHPGHPLMQSITDLMLERHRAKLRQGAVLVDPSDPDDIPRALFLVEHTIWDGTRSDASHAISRRVQFVTLDPQGNAANAGWAPHLDLEPLKPEESATIRERLAASWVTHDLEAAALAHAAQHLIPEHIAEVRIRREQQADKTLRAVHERLVKEINFWNDRYIRIEEDVKAGLQPQVQLENIRRTIDDLTARLETRTRELTAMKNILPATPVVAGGALVIPAGLLAKLKGAGFEPTETAADAANRSAVEWIAMRAVIDAERARGCEVTDVSAQKCGWDITSRPPETNGRQAPERHIEVKGRAKGQNTITVTRNEILYALNQAEKFRLAIVLVDGSIVDGPHYICNPFQSEPDWGVASVNYDLDELLARAEVLG